MDENNIDERIERLFGGLAGIAASEARILPGSLSTPLGMLSELGEKSYSGATGTPLIFEDPRMAIEARQIGRAMGTPHIPIRIGPEDRVITHNRANLIKKFPWFFDIPQEEIDNLVPQLQVRARSYAGIAHELGHAKPSMVETAALIAENPMLRALAIAGGVGLAMSDEGALQAVAPLVAAGPHLPALAEETRATYNAVRGINAVKGEAEAAKALARLLPAFLSHATHMLPAIAAPFIAKAVKGYISRKKKEKSEKTAAATPKLKIPTPPKIEGKLRKSADKAWIAPAPKPKTSTIGTPDTGKKAPPPSKRSYYKDIMLEMKDPQRGSRLGVVQK